LFQDPVTQSRLIYLINLNLNTLFEYLFEYFRSKHSNIPVLTFTATHAMMLLLVIHMSYLA